MDYLFIYTVWLMLLSATFTLFPIVLIRDWRRRGSSDGFSSVSLVLPVLSAWCWFEFGVLADDLYSST
uniref:NADH dehydrogenase subunit 4 n=1 Tax=Ditylenchus dipsaci TaxID=166011 RepID=A0A915D0R4_9BILA